MKYRAEIDGLRAFAVLSVVAFHVFPTWLKGGFIGVDIFFVISGYLITRMIFEDFDKGTFSFADFFGRRVRRIFPALLIVMVASLTFGWFVLFADGYAQLGKHVASGAAFILNFVLANEAGYFDNSAEVKPMLHLWSLSVEEQFYIIWPLILWLAWKFNFNFLLVSIIVACISFALNMKFADAEPVKVFYWSAGRFWELLSGSMLAWILLYQRETLSVIKLWIEQNLVPTVWSQKQGADGAIVENVISFAGLSALAYSVIQIDSNLSFHGAWAILPVLGSLLVITAGSKAFLNHALLMNPLAIWIGLISYPLYLWHWPILSFLRIIEGETPDLNVRIAAVVSSIILAWLTFVLIERPIRFNKSSKQIVMMSLLSVMLLVLLFGLVVFKTKGKTLPLSPKQVVASTAQFSPKRLECRFRKNDKSFLKEPCSYFEGSKVVAVVGNSHAHELAYAIAEKVAPMGAGILQYGVQGCSHIYALKKLSGQFCYEWHDKVFRAVSTDENIKYVVLSYRNEKHLKKKERRRALVRLTKDLMASGKKVILVLQAPLPQQHINDYIRREVRTTKDTIYGRTIIEWDDIYQASRDLLNELPKGVVVVDPANLFCDSIACKVIDNGTALYYDDDHMSLEGARVVADEVIKYIRVD